MLILAVLVGNPSSLLGQQSCGSYWTNWFSEEVNASNGQQDYAECKSGYVVEAIECDYRYCDNKRLKCTPYTNYCEKDEAAVPSGWSSWFTDNGNPDRQYTNTGYLMGLKCRGKYCDDLSIRTFESAFLPNPGENFCQWSPQFSEEQRIGECPGSYYAAGLACYGDYCDNLSLYCCANPYADVEVVAIDYDLDIAEVLENPPDVIAINETPNNSSTATATAHLDYAKLVGQSSWFQNSVAIGLEIGRSFSASIPYVDAEGNLALSGVKAREYGVQQEEQKLFSGFCEAEVPPCSSIVLKSIVFTSNLDVPYTMYLQSPSTGQTFTRQGVWRGVSAWYQRCEVDDAVALAQSACE